MPVFRRSRDFFSDMLRQTDLVLLALCAAASLFGILMVASATRYMHTWRLVAVQSAALLLGVVLYLLVSQVDLNDLSKYWKWIFLTGLVFILLLVTPLGIEDNTGNKAWLDFPFLPVKVQPAEIVKLTFTLVLAKQLTWLRENRDLSSIPSILFLAAHFGVIFLLYYKISSDMGSALVFLFIFACMCFVGGVALRWFIIGGLGGGLAFWALWDLNKIPSYMKLRFMVLFDHSLDPQDTGWQQTRSLMALGSGKLTGQGLFRGTQTQSEYSSALPNRHTDFIFTVIGEELGLLGCILTLALLTAIIVRCVWVARHAKTSLEGLVCIGVASTVIFQVIVNVGMCLFVMPVIGLTLPFISYGGSSLLMLFVSMGMVSGVQGRSKPEWLR
jgi:rod shape determining protein RodA